MRQISLPRRWLKVSYTSNCMDVVNAKIYIHNTGIPPVVIRLERDLSQSGSGSKARGIMIDIY